MRRGHTDECLTTSRRGQRQPAKRVGSAVVLRTRAEARPPVPRRRGTVGDRVCVLLVHDRDVLPRLGRGRGGNALPSRGPPARGPLVRVQHGDRRARAESRARIDKLIRRRGAVRASPETARDRGQSSFAWPSRRPVEPRATTWPPSRPAPGPMSMTQSLSATTRISCSTTTTVFERFRQADNSRARHHGGLGHGPSIVQHLVQLHGGTARAKPCVEEPSNAHDTLDRRGGARTLFAIPVAPRSGRRASRRGPVPDRSHEPR